MNFEVCGYEHLHLHSDSSLLDGYGLPSEYAARAKEINQQYLCISDHGMMAAVPRQIRECDKHNLTPIFACELYVNPDQPELNIGESTIDYVAKWSTEDKKVFRKSYHLLAIACNNVGYSNLVQLSSKAWTRGFYNKPRVNHQQLMQHKEGIIFTSCCYASEIGQAFDKGGEEAGFAMIEKYMAMFGDKFYLELMLLDFSKQKPYDAFIIKAHIKYGIPLILTNDVHYCKKEDSRMQQLMLMIQTGNTLKTIEEKKAADDSADLFELQDQNLWMKSEDELNQKWLSDYSDIIDYELFKQAKRNTVAICEKAKFVVLDRSMKLPQIPDAEQRLRDNVVLGFNNRSLPKTREYADRLKEELDLICRKGFASYFLIQQMITDEARDYCKRTFNSKDGTEAVGPGRGSAVGSLCCYCLGITDVNPIKHDLLFSRFLSPARGGKQMKLRFSD